MQTSSALPSSNLKISPLVHFQKPLNNLTSSSLKFQKPASTSSTQVTRLHLSNLENLLTRKPQQPNQNTNVTLKTGQTLLQRLNLTSIWPKMSASDDISPRILNRLLSLTPQYSPRNNLGSRWLEYLGSKNWDGLLDPLDEDLRREVVKYGEFVQAAYQAFKLDHATSSVALPDKSYKVTKILHATSSVVLPKWINEVAPQRTSCVGYVAVCDNKKEIQRMGRRDIVIALRGTATLLEWAENFKTRLVQISQNESDLGQGQPKVECGFLSLYMTGASGMPSLSESVIEEVKKLMEQYKGETLSITVTGHSLGAALALLVADDIRSHAAEVPPVAVFSFGGPRVGNHDFVNRINAKNIKVLRIVNEQDLITKMPGAISSDEGINKSVETYSHVGSELRVNTRMSPYLKSNADMGCCHDLEAYLHLVDGFLSLNCPFRATAKRSLRKLMDQQTSNVKTLYISKAKALNKEMIDSSSSSRDGLPFSSCLSSPSQTDTFNDKLS